MQELLQLPKHPTKEQLEFINAYLLAQKKELKKNNYGKQNYYEDRQDLTKDLCIFRHSAYKSKPYYMRFYVKDGRYKIVSLKTTDKSHAIQNAMEKWKEFSNQTDSGGTIFEKKTQEIIDEYVQTLRNNKEFSSNFSKIKYVGHSKVNVRGQDIVRFEIEASSKKSRKKNFS